MRVASQALGMNGIQNTIMSTILWMLFLWMYTLQVESPFRSWMTGCGWKYSRVRVDSASDAWYAHVIRGPATPSQGWRVTLCGNEELIVYSFRRFTDCSWKLTRRLQWRRCSYNTRDSSQSLRSGLSGIFRRLLEVQCQFHHGQRAACSHPRPE